MSTVSTSARPIRTPRFFFYKNRHDLIGAKRTPGCAFLCFLQEKTVTRAMFGHDGHNTKVYTLCFGCAKIARSRKVDEDCCSRVFILFPVFFTVVVVLFHAKLVLLFLPVVVSAYFCCVRLLVGECFWALRCRWVGVCGLHTQKPGSRLFPLCFSWLI